MSGGRLTRGALRRELRQLSRQFAEQLYATLERYGVWDQLGRGEGPPRRASPRDELTDEGRRVRRSDQALRAVGEKVLRALGAEQGPMAISAIAGRLGVAPRQVAHPLALLVAEGAVVKTGTRRGTRYELASRRGKPARRTARPPAKRAASTTGRRRR